MLLVGFFILNILYSSKFNCLFGVFIIKFMFDIVWEKFCFVWLWICLILSSMLILISSDKKVSSIDFFLFFKLFNVNLNNMVWFFYCY